MNARKLAGLALGLALPLTMVVSAAAGEDYDNMRENLGIGSYDDYKEGTGVGSYDDYDAGITVPVSSNNDYDDDGDVDYDDWGSQWSGYDDAVRDAQSAIYDEVRASIVGE